MATVDVVDVNRRKVGAVELPEAVFGVKGAVSLVHEAVVMQMACERQGTASTKRRGEVSGSGRKPWKQKHTGRARAGSIRSPVWRHGGSVFGPKPRRYAYSIPKQKYRSALQGALSAKVAAGDVTVVSDLTLEAPRTKLLANALSRLGLTGNILIVAGESRPDIAQAARNLPAVRVLKAQELNVYDVLRARSIVIPERELARIKEAWS